MTYGGNTALEIQEIFSAPLGSPCRALFICKDVIGVVSFADDDSALVPVQAFNYNTKISVNISVDLGYRVVSPLSLVAFLKLNSLCYSIIRRTFSAPSLITHRLLSQWRI